MADASNPLPTSEELLRAHLERADERQREATQTVLDTGRIANQLIFITGTMGPRALRDHPQLFAEVVRFLGPQGKLSNAPNLADHLNPDNQPGDLG